MKLIRLLTILFLAFSLGAAELPDTPAGKLGKELLDTLNSGDAARRRAFVNDRVANDLDDHLRLLDAAWEQTGGVEVIDVPARPHFRALLQGKRGGRRARLDAYPNDDGTKLVGFTFTPQATLDPSVKWPATHTDEAMAKTLRELAKRAAKNDNFSGTIVLARGERVLLHEAFGLAHRSYNVPVTTSTRLHFASTGKMFTAAAIGQFIDAGKLSMSTKVIDVLPDYPNREAAEKITIAHLLSHKAGLGDLFSRAGFDRWKDYRSHREIVALFAAEPLLLEPGTTFRYSNEGFIVLGAIIEKLSGLSWDEYMQKNVFAPAGMTSTASTSIDEIDSRLAVGYRYHDDDPFGGGKRFANGSFVGNRGNACGGQYGTAMDLFRFLRALENGKLISKKLRAEMATSSSRTYGFGSEVQTYGKVTAIGHSGGGGNSGINDYAFVIGDWTLVVLSNVEGGGALLFRAFAERLGAA